MQVLTFAKRQNIDLPSFWSKPFALRIVIWLNFNRMRLSNRLFSLLCGSLILVYAREPIHMPMPFFCSTDVCYNISFVPGPVAAGRVNGSNHGADCHQREERPLQGHGGNTAGVGQGRESDRFLVLYLL